jgi:hypothetical protein
MAILVKHNKVSSVPDTADTSLVRPSDWNADHTLTGFGTAAEKDAGVPNGVATLDSGGKVPVSELPSAVLGALSYQGTWNASTNTPTLASGTGTKGYYYVVSVAGNTDLDGITDWLIGDWAVYNGTVWQKVDNTDAVTSVNGQTGTVVLTTTNIAEGTNQYFTTARARSSVSAGTGISYNSTTGVITNSSPSLGGDVVGPASATDNALVRYDNTTGKLIQNSAVIVDDSNNMSGVNTLTTANLIVNDDTTLGGSNTDTLAVNARITTDLEPNTDAAKDIGTSGRNWRDGFFGRTLSTVNIEVTGTTSFDGSQGTSGQVLTSAGTGNTPTWTTPTVGTVTSVAATVPTGLTVSGSPITSSGTLAISYTAGYAIPTTAKQTEWDTAYSQRLQWDGGATNLVASTGRTSLGGTTVGSSFFTLANPSAITFPRINANNTISALSASDFRAAIGAGTSSTTGTVTSVGGTGTVSGISLSGTVTSSGNLTLGGALNLSSPPSIGNTTPNTVDATTISATTSILPATDNTGVVGTAALAWSNGNFTNLTVDSTLTVRSAIDLADSDILRMGSSDDWKLWYNGSTNKAQVEMEASCLGIQYTNNGTEIAYLEKSTGTFTATAFVGDGSGLTGISAAQAGGAIYENTQTITSNYTITAGSNGMSAGPITVNTGVTVTVPTGSTWVIV